MLDAEENDIKDTSSDRKETLGDNRVGTGALVSSRKGEVRRSRLIRGLGVTGLDGLGGSAGKKAMPVVEDLKALQLL